MKEITMNDLTAEQKQQMLEAIRKDPTVKDLYKMKENLYAAGKYYQAMEIRMDIEKIEEKNINIWIESINQKNKEIDAIIKSMPEVEKERAAVYCHAIILMCDIIETYTMESSQIMSKFSGQYNIDVFKELNKLCKEARANVRHFEDLNPYALQTKFGDAADDLSELIYNKDRSFVRKAEQLRKEGKV